MWPCGTELANNFQRWYIGHRFFLASGGERGEEGREMEKTILIIAVMICGAVYSAFPVSPSPPGNSIHMRYGYERFF